MWKRFFASCVFIAAVCAKASLETIIPMPKEMHAAGEAVDLKGFRIFAAKEERVLIGAAEINQRMQELGAEPLPVEELTSQPTPGNAIVLAPCTHPAVIAAKLNVTVTPDIPGKQGYIVHTERTTEGTRLFLLGSDSLGTLYAAVTCRQMIFRQGDTLALQPAEIRDWPDYRLRENGMAFSENLRANWYRVLSLDKAGKTDEAQKEARDWVARQKRYFDWMLRAKINFAWTSTHIRPGDAHDGLPVTRAALRELHEYGRVRGIRSMAGDTTAIGNFPADKDNPDFKDVVFHPSHKRYFCWSRLDYHRARAERAAAWLADAGFSGYYLHSTDGGGWENPELWNDRCPQCRQTYGNDRAAADAAVYRIYYDAIRKRVPDLSFVAVIYPYNGRYLDPEWVAKRAADKMGGGEAAEETGRHVAQDIRAFIQRLNPLLPEDMYVCIRESERRHFDAIRQAWGSRNFQLYFEYAYWKGWRPYFLTTPLWTRTYFRSSHDDILFSPMGAWTEVQQLLAVECAWNTARPGTSDYDGDRWQTWGTEEPPAERARFAERACRFMFGEAAGPLIAPVYAENISWFYIAKPDEVIQRITVEDPARLMLGQAQATGRAAASLRQLWDFQQVRPVLTGDKLGYFLNLYLFTQGAHLLATHQASMMAAKEAVKRADEDALREALTTDRETLARLGPAFEDMRKQIQPSDLFAEYVRPTSRAGSMMHVDVAALRKEADDFWDRRDALIMAHTIPQWFERQCRRRVVTAVPTSEPPRIDGVLDETAWASAWNVSHFVDYRSLRLERHETQAKVLYDSDNLYIGFECVGPDPSSIQSAFTGRDEYCLCDSVEVLVAPATGDREFVHWIVDSRGQIFDARTIKQEKGIPKYSRGWNGHATANVSPQEHGWSAEIALPQSDLGIQLSEGAPARILLCRNIVQGRPESEAEQTAVVFLDGDSFHTVSKFASLTFEAGDKEVPKPQIELKLQPIVFRHVTTGDGAGTVIGGDLSIETDHYLHDVRVHLQLSDGVSSLGDVELGKAESVALIWRPRKPFNHLIREIVPGVECRFVLTCREGEWTFLRRLGQPRRPDIASEMLYADGVDGRQRSALVVPAFLPTGQNSAIDPCEGTVELWVRPRWDAGVEPTGPRFSLRHTFLNLGPIRPDYPYLSNTRSLTVGYHRKGHILAKLSNSRYQALSAEADVRNWQKGEWHHIAVQWHVPSDGEPSLSLFLDGGPAQPGISYSPKEQQERPFKMDELQLPLQLGAMNTGFAPGDTVIDELRVSDCQRYSGAFEPSKRMTADDKTRVLFHFDGSVEASAPEGAAVIPGLAQ